MLVGLESVRPLKGVDVFAAAGRVWVQSDPDLVLEKDLHVEIGGRTFALERRRSPPSLPDLALALPLVERRTPTAELRLDALPRWRLEGRPTAQIRILEPVPLQEIELVEPVDLPPGGPTELHVELAAHRAFGRLEIRIETEDGLRRTIATPFDPAFRGGTDIARYQRVRTPLPPSRGARRMGLAVVLERAAA